MEAEECILRPDMHLVAMVSGLHPWASGSCSSAFGSHLSCFLALYFFGSSPNLLSLGFLTWQIRVIKATLEGCCKD